MAKIIRMTEEEIFKNYDMKKAIDMAKSAPEEKELPFNSGTVVARDLAEVKEYLNKRSQTKLATPKVASN